MTQFVSKPRNRSKAVVSQLQGGTLGYHQCHYDNSIVVNGPRLLNCLNLHICQQERKL